MKVKPRQQDGHTVATVFGIISSCGRCSICALAADKSLLKQQLIETCSAPMLGNLSWVAALPWSLSAGLRGNGEQLQHVKSEEEFIMAPMTAHAECPCQQCLCGAGVPCLTFRSPEHSLAGLRLVVWWVCARP